MAQAGISDLGSPLAVASVLFGQFRRITGLAFVYPGNLAGMVGEHENTRCPKCGELLIERYGFAVLRNQMSGPACRSCGERIPGVWEDDPGQSAGGRGVPRRVGL